jgi:hypothetical protein
MVMLTLFCTTDFFSCVHKNKNRGYIKTKHLGCQTGLKIQPALGEWLLYILMRCSACS